MWFIMGGVVQGYLPSGVSRAVPWTRSLFALGGMTLEELERDVKNYLAYKNSTEVSELENPKGYKDIGTRSLPSSTHIFSPHTISLVRFHILPYHLISP